MRTFIAAPLSAELIKKLATLQNELKKRLSGENMRPAWVRPEGIHLTLRFLGEMEESLLEPIADRLEGISAGFPPLQLQVKELGAFPDAKRPRVLWLGLHGDRRISDLAAEVKASLSDLPLEPDDKTFKAHLTLARIKETSGSASAALKRIIEEKHDEEFAVLHVTEIRLYRSHLKQSGAEYEVLKSFRLGAKAGT